MLLLLGSPFPAAGQAPSRLAPKRDPETAVLAGRVIDGGTGKPVNGAIVTVTAPESYAFFFRRRARPPRISVTTGTDGTFSFRNVMAGTYRVSASKPGFAPGGYGQRRPGGSSRGVEIDQAEQTSITIALWRYSAITGRIVDEAGEPVVGQEVRALRRFVAGGRIHLRSAGHGWTDDRGIYRIGTLLPGTYLVVAPVTQHAAPVSMTAASAQAPAGTAIVPIGSTLLVIDVDSPVPPLARDGNRVLIYPTQFYPGAPAASQASPIVVGSGEERADVDFQFLPFPGSRVSGRAYDARPGSYVTLRLFPALTVDASDEAVAEAFSDANGAFTFPAVPPGDYVLKAVANSAEDNRWAVLGFSVGQRDVSDLDVVLRPGLRISGRLEFSGGPQSILREMHVAIAAADGDAIDVEPVAVAPSGRFTIERLPAGRYVLAAGGIPSRWMLVSVTHDGRDVTDGLTLTADANDVVITLSSRLTEVHGTVSSANGPDPDALVVLFPSDRDGWGEAGPSPRRVRRVRPDKAGEFVVEGLPPGDYYAAAIPAAEVDEDDPSVFAALARSAEAVRLDEGTKTRIHLRTRTVSRR